MKKYFAIAVCFLCLLDQSMGQVASNRLVQYSGVVLSADSLQTPVPYASVFNRSIHLGAVANFQGFFSFAAKVGDTIEISSVGYEKGMVIVPDIPQDESYTAIILLNPAITVLPTAVIYPWFSKEQFRDAFVHINIPDDDLARANENLDQKKLNELGQFIVDANLNAMHTMQNYSYTYYYQGQYQPTPILSPTAWMQFFSALKNGDLKQNKD